MSVGQYQIRRGLGNKEDALRLVKYMEAMDQWFDPPIGSLVPLSGLVDKYLKFGKVLVILHDDQVLGMLAYYSNDMDARVGYISYVAIHPSLRGTGSAAMLMAECLRDMEASGMHTAHVRCDVSRPGIVGFYRNAGFHVEREEVLDDGRAKLLLAVSLTGIKVSS